MKRNRKTVLAFFAVIVLSVGGLALWNVASAQGFEAYRRQAEKGDPKGQYNLGVCYMKGDGVEKDEVEAYKWFRLSALQGFADAEFCVALCLGSGSGVKQDGEEAAVWLRRAADKGHKMAKEQLRAMEKPSAPKTRKVNVAETLKAADRGDAQAQYDMGFFYSRGVGVEKDDVRSAVYYRKAAEQGFMLAQHNLGCCYATGQGVAKDYAEAQKWFVKAAEQGDLEAQFNAGLFYYREMGMGAKRDEYKGAKWFLTYLKSAERRGVDFSDSNPRTAVRAVEEFLSKANPEDIEKWDREFMLLLCECYREGIGLKKDAKEADKWYRMAGDAARGGKLAFLWCVPGFDRGTVERRVEEANFSVKTATDWDEKPTVKNYEARFGMEKQAQYRFMGPGKTQWLAVEYMRLDEETPVAKDISTWVKAGMMLKGQVDLIEPDGVSFKMLSIGQLPEADAAFLEKHHADMMSSHVGTVKIGEMYHRFFIVCLNRGRESWKIVKVFPVHPPDGCSEDEACKITKTDLMIGGLFIGNFRILSDKKLAAYPNVPRKPNQKDGELGEKLLAAISSNDVTEVRRCLEKGASANYKGFRGRTPLGAAIGESRKRLNPEIVKALLEGGADPKAKWGTCGTTPFFSFVQSCVFGKPERAELSNQVAVVKLMLKHGADPNEEQGLFRKSPLGYAVMRQGDIGLIKALVEGGAVVTDKIIESAKDEAVKQYLIKHR